jgi:hypothetical protein
MVMVVRGGLIDAIYSIVDEKKPARVRSVI